MINVFLDDLRPSPKGFVLAKTVEEAIDLVKHYWVKIISLDHDLGGLDGTYTKTGYDFCKWLTETWYSYETHGITKASALPETIYLHTSNPVGRNNMFQILERYKPEDVKIYRSPMPSYNLNTGELLDY